MVDERISSGFAGLGTAGVVVGTAGGGVTGAAGVDAGGVTAGAVGVAGVDTGGVTGITGGAGGLVQPASRISAATITRTLLNEASLFNIIIPSFKFLTK